MIKSNGVALRRIWPFKLNSLINILGLAMAVAVAIFPYTFHHFSLDKAIPDGENAYRLISRYEDGSYNANTFASFDDILPDYSEITSFTTCYTNQYVEEVRLENQKFKNDDVIFVNPDF